VPARPAPHVERWQPIITEGEPEDGVAFDRKQFRDLIVRVLDAHGLGGDAAVNLLLGTAAVESRFGTFLRQLSGGPAVGVFQMEPATFNWLRDLYQHLLGSRHAREMEADLALAIVAARLRYRVVREALPPADNVQAQARYWKRYYNTHRGAGSEADYIRQYRRFVAPGE